MLLGLGEFNYGERLNRLSLFSLEQSRKIDALIEICKCMKGMTRIDSQFSHSKSIKNKKA